MELSTFDQPDTREACQEAIMAHTNTKQRVFGINVDQLISEGRALLRALVGPGPPNETGVSGDVGARDSGYSGTSNSGGDLDKLNCDYFGEASKLKEPIETLRTSKQKIHHLWQQKKLKLEQCLQLRIFEQDCNQVLIKNLAF
jgi:hypothetical protein